MLDHRSGRRVEVTADGLPLFRGAQVAVDTNLLSTMRADGMPRREAIRMGGGCTTGGAPDKNEFAPNA